VTALRACLVERCGVAPDAIRLLVDPDTPQLIADTVDAAAREAERALLFWYVGHGLLNESNELHLATYGSPSDLANGGLAAYQALPYEQIRRAVTRCRAGSIAIVVDCCFAGRAVLPASDSVFHSLTIGGGYLLTSASPHERALAPEGAITTAFTGAAIEFLAGGDPAGGPVIRLHDLYRHLRRALPYPAPRQVSSGTAGDLILADNPAFRLHAPGSDQDAPSGAGPEICPWPGLAAYRPDEAEWFRGRGALTDALIELVTARAGPGGGPVVVVGPSGAGKSSLLAAGLLPAIEHGRLGIAGSAAWPQLILTPGADPLGTLAERLAPLSGRLIDDARRMIAAAPGGLASLVGRVLEQLGTPAQRLVLVVDQFEEIFTLCDDGSSRDAFVAGLCAVGGTAMVLLGLRADVYGQCLAYPMLRPTLTHGQLPVGPMTPDEIWEAIVEPAEAAGLRWEDGLAELIVRELGHGLEPGSPTASLPLLSHTLWETWRRSDRRTLTHADYHHAGGVRGAVILTAETSYATLAPASQKVVRALLPRMTRIRPDGTVTRRQLAHATIQNDPAARAALNALADARLVNLGAETVEIIHEELLREWPRLRRWIDEDRRWIATRDQVHDAASAWNDDNRDPSHLYRGTRLRDVHAQIAATAKPDLDPTARAFLTASDDLRNAEAAARQARAAKERQSAHRLRALVAALTVSLLVAIAAALLAAQQQRLADDQGKLALSRQLAAEAITLGSSHPDIARQLAVLAWRTAHTVEAHQSLFAVEALPIEAPLDGRAIAVANVAGRWLAASVNGNPGTPVECLPSGAPATARHSYRPRGPGLHRRFQPGLPYSGHRRRRPDDTALGYQRARETAPPQHSSRPRRHRLSDCLQPRRPHARDRQRRQHRPALGHPRSDRAPPAGCPWRPYWDGLRGRVQSQRSHPSHRWCRRHRAAVGHNAAELSALSRSAHCRHRPCIHGRLQSRRSHPRHRQRRQKCSALGHKPDPRTPTSDHPNGSHRYHFRDGLQPRRPHPRHRQRRQHHQTLGHNPTRPILIPHHPHRTYWHHPFGRFQPRRPHPRHRQRRQHNPTLEHQPT